MLKMMGQKNMLKMLILVLTIPKESVSDLVSAKKSHMLRMVFKTNPYGKGHKQMKMF